MADYGGSLRGGVGPGLLPGTGGDDNLLDFSRILQEYGINGAGAGAASAMPYGPGRYPDPVQPNTLEPYTGLPPLGESPTTTPEREAYLSKYGIAGPGMGGPPLPMAGNGGMVAGNGGMALPVAQATELPGMLPTMDVAPTQPNPWQTFARMAQGAYAGMRGVANPVIEMEQQQQRLDQNALALRQEAALRQQSHLLAVRNAELAEQREKRLETQHLQTLRSTLGTQLLNSDDDAGVKAGLDILRESGVYNLPPNLEKEFIGSKLAKTYQKRLDAVIQAIEVGVDPKTTGVSLAGIDVDKLTALDPDQRAGLASPEYQKNAMDLAEKRLKIANEKLVQDIKQRSAEGKPVSTAEMKIAGINPKNVGEVAAEIVADHYANPKKPMTPLEQGVVSNFMMQNKLGGITGEAAVAMRAAGGDKDAQRAFNMLNQEQRRMTQVDLMMQAGMVRAKMQVNPTYEPTLQERAILAAADGFAAQKSSKPVPMYMEKRFDSMRTIALQMETIDDAMSRGGEKYIGKVAGKVGRAAESGWAEWIGLDLHDKTRSQLYTAIDGLLAEIGPEKFGGQFTGPEQKIVRDYKAEVTSPSGQFTVRHEAFRDLMRRKYDDSVRVAKTNQYRIPDEFVDTPAGLTKPTAGEKKDTDREATIKKRTKELLLEGKTREQVIQQLRKEGFQ